MAERTAELSAANQALKGEIREKEVLLQEVHHRVKNNLQTISSLLSLQVKGIEDQGTLSLFEDTHNRIKSMALVHEKIYHAPQLAHIDFAEYIRDLVKDLINSYRGEVGGIVTEFHLDEVSLSLDTAIPCGLIVNELVSNALKHAFPAGGAGGIHVELRAAGEDEVVLLIRDSGVGLPEGVDVQNVETLGLRLVQSWVRQLRGAIEYHNEGGATFRVRFRVAGQ